MNANGHRAAVTLLLVVLLMNLMGCSWLDRKIGSIGATRGSYDLEGERVELVMLDQAALESELDRYNIDRQSVASKNKEFAVLAAVVPFIVEKAYDIVVDQLKKEADRYEQQYSATASASGFWLTEGKSRWKGFVLRRYTTSGGDTPVATYLCLLLPLENGTFLSVRPLYVNITHSKAKVIGNKVTAKVAITQRSMWIDGEGVLQNRDLQTFEWSVSGFEFGKRPRYFNCATSQPSRETETAEGATPKPKKLTEHAMLEAGVLVGPPRSAVVDEDAEATEDASGALVKPVKPRANGGLMRLSVSVTERDETNAQQIVQKAAKFTEDKKPAVMKYIKSKFEPATAPATAPGEGE